MRITNLLHFTENHRFCVYRDFSLSSLDYRMLGGIYQPMVGAYAISVYSTLCQQLAADRAGFSALEQQRSLFLSLELEPGERGRKFFIEQTSKLEAVGLLQTTRRFLPAADDYIYEYQLYEPLSPGEFFKNQHLTMLLRDKVGKYMLLSLKDELVASEPGGMEGSNAENLSVPFYELFRLNTQVIDYELEQALHQTASTRDSKAKLDVTTKGFTYSDIIMRFPRGSRNRAFVEALNDRQDQLVEINIMAKKYDLSLQETCRLLDEDSVFDEEGTLRKDAFQYKANLFYRQGKKREEQVERHLQKVVPLRSDETVPAEEKPVEMAYYLEVPALFQDQCDVHQYNMILRNEPYTVLLKKFFSQGQIPDRILDIFEKVDLNYKLSEEVINVLIHYIHTERRSWSKASIEFVAAEMLANQVTTYESAVEYIRAQIRYKEQAAAKASGQTGYKSRTKPKPRIPIVRQDTTEDDPVSAEEFEEMRRLAQKLDGKL
ncbi:DnaD domain protein [Paenibacillus sp. CC-CFT747]|nr:DnaD domain protein [Paenibacillus sp. CC-CFT747]